MRSALFLAVALACSSVACLDTKSDTQASDPTLHMLDAGVGSDKPPLAQTSAPSNRGVAAAAAGSGSVAASTSLAQRSKAAVPAQAGSSAVHSNPPLSDPQPTAAGAHARSAGEGGSAGAAGDKEIPSEPTPMHVGDLVITELMIDPKALPDTQGEWFELYNASSGELSLRDCQVDDGVETLHALATPLQIPAGEYATLARGQDPGFMPSATVALSLTNTADTLAIICAGIEVDRVSYDRAAGFAIKPGVTLSLDPGALSAEQNDFASAWCAGQNLYNDDLGTPGRANPSCHAQEDETLDASEKQPDAGAGDAGAGDAGMDAGY